jgi:hypothetical protein
VAVQKETQNRRRYIRERTITKEVLFAMCDVKMMKRPFEYA